MKQLLLTFFLLATIPVFAQTYYYERTAVVENGVKKEASGDGHFITFTPQGCYDSDRDGMSENSGFRIYQRTDNNIRNYYGDSCFGKAYYYFSADYSRLNIKKESTGTIYVYAKKSAPADLHSSSRKQSATVSGSTGLPVYIPVPVSATIDNGVNGASGTERNSSRYGYYTCPSCHGSGKCPVCGGRQLMNNSYTGNTIVCYSCNNRGQCSACGGTGKKYGIIK